MAKRSDQLKKLLQKRETFRPREAVAPVRFYKEGERQRNERRIERFRKPKSYNLRKFASYITADSYRKMKIIAINEDKKIYEIVQDAVDTYIALKSKPVR